MFRKSLAVLTLLTASLATSGVAQAQTLFERLGGLPAIECWIDTGLPIIVGNRRIGDFFAGELNAG